MGRQAMRGCCLVSRLRILTTSPPRSYGMPLPIDSEPKTIQDLSGPFSSFGSQRILMTLGTFMTIQKIASMTAIAIVLVVTAQLILEPLNFSEIKKLERLVRFLKESLSP